MVVWDGACGVHEEFSLEKILELKKKYPEAKVLAHPECKKTVLLAADYIGSTAALLRFASTDPADTFIVVTEAGILYQMRKENPGKTFIPGSSRRRFLRMQQLRVHENGHARQDIPCVA